MSWDSTMPLLLRNVIGDTDPTSPKYTDDQMMTVLLAAAQFVTFRVALRQKYAIDLDNQALLPDPTDLSTRDDAFINLVTLKAACMLMNAEVRRYGQQAIAIRDGTSAIDLKRDLKTLQAIAQNYCTELDKAITDYMYSVYVPGEAVIGPFKTIVARLEQRGCGYPLRVCR